jgi:glucosyl-3-phosphoglycerate synthase
MSDLFQNGSIVTLQNLTNRSTEDIENALREFADRRNMVLLLPSLYSEFEGPAMPKIVKELEKADYINRIVLSLDRASESQFKKVKELMKPLPQNVRIVWHDGPRMKKIQKELKGPEFWLDYPGKGRSVWLTLGYILEDKNAYAIGLHDCDIVNYRRDLIARLFFPVVHPALDFEFSKGFYARVTDRIYGRVTRLFYTPIIRSLKKMLGYNPFLEYLDSFRYSLSGEFAFIRSLARGIRISPTWGLEVSMLSEVYNQTSVNRVAQVEIMDTYEHKHQILKRDQPDDGLMRMVNDITKTLLRVLSQDGVKMSTSFFMALVTTYLQESKKAAEKYRALSMFNNLKYEYHDEIDAVESFVEALRNGIREFEEDPISIPMLSAWVRVRTALPQVMPRMSEAVDEDNS